MCKLRKCWNYYVYSVRLFLWYLFAYVVRSFVGDTHKVDTKMLRLLFGMLRSRRFHCVPYVFRLRSIVIRYASFVCWLRYMNRSLTLMCTALVTSICWVFISSVVDELTFVFCRVNWWCCLFREWPQHAISNSVNSKKKC